jgi:hypothetical protein
MMQRPIVAYLSLKWMSTREIHDDIVANLGPDTVYPIQFSSVQFSSITRYFHEAQFPPPKPELYPVDIQRDFDDSDQAILVAPEDGLFASVRQLSRLTHLPSTIVYHLSSIVYLLSSIAV